VVLLDPRVFVKDVQGRGYVLCQDPGTKPPRRLAGDLAIEDQLDFLRATQIEVLADYLFEEQAAVHWSIQHLGQRELGLQDRDVVAVTGLAIDPGERMGQQAQPFAQQGIDLACREAVADLLQAFGVGAVQDAVVERLERDTFLGELAFGVFVAVQAQLGIEGK